MSEDEAFDRAFRCRSAWLEVRLEQPHDADFLHWLAMRCSPLADVLPAPILAQQAASLEASQRAEYPGAMRRILTASGIPVGRIAIEWGSDRVSHGVDIAVLPEFRRKGAALCMLRAWLDVADSGGWRCTLQVRRDNPAVRLYKRLDFSIAEEASADTNSPFLQMVRIARPIFGAVAARPLED